MACPPTPRKRLKNAPQRHATKARDLARRIGDGSRQLVDKSELHRAAQGGCREATAHARFQRILGESAMRCVTFLGGRKLQIGEFPDPAPGPHDVVVEIKASGMCGSDLKFYRATGGETATLGLGSLEGPVIAGHEPCGVVVAVGKNVDDRTARIGARVMVHHYSGCGTCSHCRSGWAQMVNARSTLYGVTAHGAHADYMKVPAHTLVPLPDELSFATGAAVSCGTGTAYGALRRMNLSGAHAIAIVGQGPVGLSATQLPAAMGARVIALDVSAERLARAKEFGADAVVDPKADDAVMAIQALTHGAGVDLALGRAG